MSELFDTHCHLFEQGFHGGGPELDAYERLRAEFGITRSLVVGYDEGDFAGNSDYIEELARERDWLVPLRYLGGDLDFARSPGAVAIYATDAATGIRVADALAAADELPTILSLNVTPEALAVLEPVLRTLEQTWVLISHLGLPGPVDPRERLGPLLRLAGVPHVSVKLSGQYATTDVQVLVDLIAERFGSAALVWGSDFTPCLDFVTFEQAVDCVLPTGITPAERHDILFGNADRSFHQYAGALR